jgi:hypothetical protein
MTSDLDSTSARRDRKYWVTPVTGVAIGLLCLIGFSIGGQPVLGAVALAIMVTCSAGLVLLGRRSETVHGLLSRRDERITSMDPRATAITAGGVTYVACLVWFRLRG